jgi:hypothetical protein
MSLENWEGGMTIESCLSDDKKTEEKMNFRMNE